MEITSLMMRAAPLLLDVSLKSLPVFAAAGLACFGLRRASAAARHALWLVVFVSLLCLPALCLLLPRWAAPLLPAAVVRGPDGMRPTPSRAETTPPPLTPPSALNPLRPAKPAGAAAPRPTLNLTRPDARPGPMPARLPDPGKGASAPAARLHAASWLVLLWFGGVLLALARASLGLASARRLVRGCVPASPGPLREAAEEARRALGLARAAALRQGTPQQAVAVPMTFGFFRPVVLLPREAAAWPADRLRVVLLHEMAHVGRGDWLTLLLAQFVCALYWFHPLVRLAARRLRVESEAACDDRVLTCGVPAPDYAAHLLEIVYSLPKKGLSMPATVTMAQEPEIRSRLRTILAHPRSRSGMTRRGLVLAMLTTLLLVMPLAAMHPSRRPAPALVGNVAVLTDAPWTARLSDGTLVRLVSVIKTNRKGHELGAAWAPDGGPVADSGAASGRGLLTTLVNVFSDQGGVVSLRMAAAPPKPYKVAVVSTSGGRRGHLGIGLQFSAGPYTTLITGPLERGASHRLPSGNWSRSPEASPAGRTAPSRAASAGI